MVLVKDVMTRNTIAIPKHAEIDVAIDLMVENSISGVPVVDENDSLVGLITEYDVLQLYGNPGAGCQEHAPCERYMTHEVKTVQQSAALDVAAKIFQVASLRRLLVLDGEKFVGVLSRRDVVRSMRDSRLSPMNQSAN